MPLALTGSKFFNSGTNFAGFTYKGHKPKRTTLKKISFFLLALSFAYMGHAQEISPGVKAKNGLFDKFKAIKISFVTQSSKLEPNGPKAKNKSPWAENQEKGNPIEFTSGEPELTGPTFKNAKPNRKKEPKVSTKAAYQEPKSMRPRKRWIH